MVSKPEVLRGNTHIGPRRVPHMGLPRMQRADIADPEGPAGRSDTTSEDSFAVEAAKCVNGRLGREIMRKLGERFRAMGKPGVLTD